MRLSVIEFAMKHFMAAKANPCIHNMSSRIKLCVRGLCFGWRAREIVNAENGSREESVWSDEWTAGGRIGIPHSYRYSRCDSMLALGMCLNSVML